MPYLNVDDSMPDHPKIEELSDAAYRLHMAAMHYSARWMTDGYVPRSKARRLTRSASDVVITELIKADLWHEAGEGCPFSESVEAHTCHSDGRAAHYIVHDYLQWNHSRHWWIKRRQKEAERKAKWRANRDATRDGTSAVP